MDKIGRTCRRASCRRGRRSLLGRQFHLPPLLLLESLGKEIKK